MKLGEVIPQYRAYRQKLVDEKNNIAKKKEVAEKRYELTGDKKFADEAADLQLSLEESDKAFKNNQKILDSLLEQYTNAWNAEVSKQEAEAGAEYAENLGKIMITVARMCAGDKVPYSDEKKVMEYDSDMYTVAKQTQAMMAAIKKERKEYDSLWEEEEEKTEFDPEAVAENTEAIGDFSVIPTQSIEINSDMEGLYL